MSGMIKTSILFLLTLPIFGQDSWLEDVSQKADQETINWVRELIKKDTILKESNIASEQSLEILSKQKCRITNLENQPFRIYAFLSFSVSQTAWLELSEELKKVNGVIVLRGIPENSFKEFYKKIQALDQQGFSVTLQINPLLFEKYEIAKVPAFVVTDGDIYDKVMGNISVKSAIELMASKGETIAAKNLALKLCEKEMLK